MWKLKQTKPLPLHVAVVMVSHHSNEDTNYDNNYHQSLAPNMCIHMRTNNSNKCRSHALEYEKVS